MKVLDIFDEKNYYCVVREYCDGNLREKIDKNTGLPEEKAKEIFMQIVVGLV